MGLVAIHLTLDAIHGRHPLLEHPGTEVQVGASQRAMGHLAPVDKGEPGVAFREVVVPWQQLGQQLCIACKRSAESDLRLGRIVPILLEGCCKDLVDNRNVRNGPLVICPIWPDLFWMHMDGALVHPVFGNGCCHALRSLEVACRCHRMPM